MAKKREEVRSRGVPAQVTDVDNSMRFVCLPPPPLPKMQEKALKALAEKAKGGAIGGAGLKKSGKK